MNNVSSVLPQSHAANVFTDQKFNPYSTSTQCTVTVCHYYLIIFLPVHHEMYILYFKNTKKGSIKCVIQGYFV